MSYPYTPESLPSTPGSDSGSEDDTMRLLLEATERLSVGPTITREEVLNDIAGLRHALDGMTTALDPQTGWIRESDIPIYNTFRAIRAMLQSANDDADPSGATILRPNLLDDPTYWDAEKTVELANALIAAHHEIRGQMVNTLEFIGNLYAPRAQRHQHHTSDLLSEELTWESAKSQSLRHKEAVAEDGAQTRGADVRALCRDDGDTTELVKQMRVFEGDVEYYRELAEEREETCRILQEAVELLTRG